MNENGKQSNETKGYEKESAGEYRQDLFDNEIKDLKGPVSFDFEQREYDLDASRVMDVISDISTYISTQMLFAKKRLPDKLTPAVHFVGNGRTMIVSGEQRKNESVVQGCNLAELVLSEDGQSLTMSVHEQKAVTIMPDELYHIGETYSK